MNFIEIAGKAAWEIFKTFILELYRNILSVTILILAACGLTRLLSQIPIEVFFVSVPLISETMIVGVLSVILVYLLVCLIPKWQLCLDN